MNGIARIATYTKHRESVDRAHPAPPGSGPAGKTCRTCRHRVVVEFAKRYHKCGRNRANWTAGNGTDIKVRDAACLFYQEEE